MLDKPLVILIDKILNDLLEDTFIYLKLCDYIINKTFLRIINILKEMHIYVLIL